MSRAILAACLILLLPLSARASEPEFDIEQPFKQGEIGQLLRSLLNEAMDVLDDHLAITGDLGRERANGDREGRLEFRFYPEGKSTSDEHVKAEGWFRYSPESELQDLHLRFQLPKHRSKQPPTQPENVL
jgi:hypothetical protein